MKQYPFATLIFLVLLLPLTSYAQKADTTATYSVNVYLDAYYALYTDNAGNGKFQQFPTVSPRNNSAGLNIAKFTTQYDGTKVRAMASLHFGDIPQCSWSGTYNILEEAHAGVKLSKTLWLDAGFFRTHFGTEFLLPIENIASAVTITTVYEPYYESGMRLEFTPNAQWDICLLLVNGYGIYQDNNDKKSVGASVTYALSSNTGIGYTNYTGDDGPDKPSLSHLRIAQNVYINHQYKKLKIQAGGDLYTQQNSDIATGHKTAWQYSGLIAARYQLKPRFGAYGRIEAFHDESGIMGIITDTRGIQTGYILRGVTGGVEYKPTPNSYIRFEGRKLQMDKYQKIFNFDGEARNYRYEVMVDVGFSF